MSVKRLLLTLLTVVFLSNIVLTANTSIEDLYKMDTKIEKKLSNKKLNNKILDVINSFIKYKKLRDEASIDTGFNIDFKNVSYLTYANSFKDKIEIDLDKELQKSLRKNGYDLSKYISFDMFKYLVGLLRKYPGSLSCNNKIKLNPITYVYYAYKGKKVYIDYETRLGLLGCYLKRNIDKYSFSHTLGTYSKKYRQHNINVGLGLFNGIIWRKGVTLDVGQIILDADNKEKPIYVNGYVLKSNGSGEIKEPIEYGGGLCGISTVIYQSVLYLKDIEILERKPHSIWFRYLYGNNLGADANIYWKENGNKRNLINTLRLLNNQQDLLIYTETWNSKGKFYNKVTFYGIKPLKKVDVKFFNRIEKRGNLQCVKFKKGDEIIQTCYRKIK